MKCYETVWEIFNKCANNQMRDVFIEELEIEDIDAFLQEKFKGKEVTFDKTVQPDGTIVYDIIAYEHFFIVIFSVKFKLNIHSKNK